MELRHLRYFRAVAETLNFNRAAEQLRVAQSALSRQIRDLEEEIGVRLFDRNRVRVQLTDAGRMFYPEVCRLLAHLDLALTSVREATRGVGGNLVVSTDWRLSLHVIPETVGRFRALYPAVQVEFVDLPVNELIAAVRSGRAHLCFLPRETIPNRTDLALLPVLQANVGVILGRGHRLARRKSIQLADLAQETFIRISDQRAKGHGAHITKLCRTAGFSPIFGSQDGTSLESLLALIGAGFGITLLPDFLCPPQNPLVRFVRSDCPPIELCAVWLRAARSRILEQYLDILRAQVGTTGSAA